MSRGLGTIQQKVILLLQAGLALGLTPLPKAHFHILNELGKEWGEINRASLDRAIKNLYRSKMVEMKYDKRKETITVVLTDNGKKKALAYNLDKLEIKKPKNWDGKWRVVLFDIPETHKRERNVLRSRLKLFGFFEYQKSVFIHPYDCKDEVEYIIELDNIRKFVRFIVADFLDNELHLKKHFSLL